MTAYLQFPTWMNPEIIPGLPFRWYGLMYLVGFAIVYLLFNYQIKKRKLNVKEDDISSFFFYGILGLLLGARIFATLVYDRSNNYWAEPWKIFWPFAENWQFTGFQGMSFHGGAIGLIIGCLIFCKVKKIDFLDWADMIAAAAPLGYTFGRLGNFINGELYGRITDSPIGMVFPNATPFSAKEGWVQAMADKLNISFNSLNDYINLPRHPSQLYELCFEGLVLGLLMWFVLRPNKPFKGFLVAAYLLGYGLIRFVIEYFRMPDQELGFILRFGEKSDEYWRFTSIFNISMGQILCFLMIVSGIALLFIFHKMHKNSQIVTNEHNPKMNARKLRKMIK